MSLRRHLVVGATHAVLEQVTDHAWRQQIRTCRIDPVSQRRARPGTVHEVPLLIRVPVRVAPETVQRRDLRLALQRRLLFQTWVRDMYAGRAPWIARRVADVRARMILIDELEREIGVDNCRMVAEFHVRNVKVLVVRPSHRRSLPLNLDLHARNRFVRVPHLWLQTLLASAETAE